MKLLKAVIAEIDVGKYYKQIQASIDADVDALGKIKSENVNMKRSQTVKTLAYRRYGGKVVKMVISLHKVVGDELRWIDYGVYSRIEDYVAQGYIVIIYRNKPWKGNGDGQQR